jgi:hypothetical protein
MVTALPTLFEAFLFEHFFAIMFKQFGAFMHVVNQMGKILFPKQNITTYNDLLLNWIM